MPENETRRAITVKLLSGGTWRSLLLAVLLLAVVRRSLELGTLANVDALGGTILTLTLLALINATFGFGLGLAAGSYLTRAKRRAPVLTWACALYGAILCVAALSSSLPVFLLLIGCATGIGVFINAGETMIETGYLDSETEIVTANALRGATLQSLQLIAPLIAGTLLALVAPRMLIVIAAITSIIPLLVFARLPLEVRTDEQTGTSATTLPALLRAIRGHVAHDRDLQIFFSVQAIVMIVLGMQGPLIFTYIIEERGFGVPQFAFLMAALGAGAAQRGFVHLDQYAAFAHSDHGAIDTRWCCPVGLCSNGYPVADFRIYGSHGFNWRGLHDCDALISAITIRSGRTRYTDRGFLRHSGTFPDDGSRVPFVNLAVFHGIADPAGCFPCGDRVKCCPSSCRA